MSAAETIAKAIDKLVGLKVESTRGEWRSLVTSGEHWHIDSPDAEEMVGFISANDGLNEARRQPNADLIVTLHRTIDAQLAILRHVLAHYRGDLGISTNRHVVALAEAILGEEADR